MTQWVRQAGRATEDVHGRLAVPNGALIQNDDFLIPIALQPADGSLAGCVILTQGIDHIALGREGAANIAPRLREFAESGELSEDGTHDPARALTYAVGAVVMQNGYVRDPAAVAERSK